ncbi:MAG TPA: glycosyltransferase family protein [Paludibacter sp.]|nr:glycosyltransferase family protein [Paludibacter sp.]
MKYLFVVQGEGRGHFTQALSLKNMLERNGHEVVAVMVGRSSKRTLPDFFTKKIGTEIIQFRSPNFLPTPKGKSSFLLVSILYNLFLLPVYIQSIIAIYQTIKDKKPDVVMNLYELLCGLTYGVLSPKPPMVSVAHQYYFLTPDFKYTGKKRIEFELLNFYSRLTSLNSTKILALSFRQEIKPNYNSNIVIVPPLLRPEVLRLKPVSGNYIHGYMLNSGFVNDLTVWSNRNNNERLHFFWDKKNVSTVQKLTDSLVMHNLDDTLFLKYMAGSKAYATTGGFESVCEAMYLQKPVLMVPAHIEQECNVIDALRTGAGVTSNRFELDLLLNFIPTYNPTQEFYLWVKSAEYCFVHHLTQIETEPDNFFVTI